MLFPGEFSCKPRSYRYISSAARKNNTSIMTSLRVIYGVVERSFSWMYQYRKWTTSIEWIFLLFLFDELFLADTLTGSESIREFLMPVSANLGYMTWWNDLVRSCVPCNFFMRQNDNICLRQCFGSAFIVYGSGSRPKSETGSRILILRCHLKIYS